MSYKATNRALILSFFGICFLAGWFIYNGISNIKQTECAEPQVIITECTEPEIIYQEPEIEYYPEYVEVEKQVEIEKIVEVVDKTCQIELSITKEVLSVLCAELPTHILCL